MKKIIPVLDLLPPGDAAQLLMSLSNIISLAAVRVQDSDFLTGIVANPEYVPLETLRKIMRKKEVRASLSGDVMEELYGYIPEHLRE